MKKRLLLLLALLTLLLSACGGREGESSVTVWRAVSAYYTAGGELVRGESRTVAPGVDAVNSAISYFNTEPSDQELKRPLPSGMRILGYVRRGGELRLELPASFAALDGERITLARCCMALTFCSLEGVSYVSVWSDGEELFPPLSPDDIVLADHLS